MPHLSISHPHPVGFENPVTLRAAAVLAAAGAWDAAPLEVACAGAWWVRFYFTYTRAALGGAVSYRWEISPYSANIAGVEDWFQGTLYVPDDIDPPCEDVIGFVQRETIRYCSADVAGAQTFVSPPIHLAGCLERLRLNCSETGTPLVPGDCHVVGVFYVEG